MSSQNQRFSAPVAIAVFFLLSSPALGEICAPREWIIERLRRQYSEEQVAIGVKDDGSLIERFQSRDGHSWTLVNTHPNGVACLIAAGTDWEALAPRAPSRRL